MNPAIQALNLTKIFGESTAVNHISFDVWEGEIFGFLGPNGAGKTTTTRMLTGVIPPDAGTAMILGHDIRSEPVLAKQGFGVVPETSNAYTDLTAWQNLMLMGELYGLLHSRAEQRSSDLLGMVGLLERKDQKVQAYSKGMKQRLILAMALIHEPELLFLDEPTSGLDVESTRMILALLRDLNEKGTTILVGIILAGKMVAVDAPEKLKTAIDRVHKIEVSFDREVPADALVGLAGITSAERTGDKWQITAENRDSVIRSLVGFSRQQDVTIVTLNTLAPSLDDAFLQLTKGGKP